MNTFPVKYFLKAIQIMSIGIFTFFGGKYTAQGMFSALDSQEQKQYVMHRMGNFRPEELQKLPPKAWAPINDLTSQIDNRPPMKARESLLKGAKNIEDRLGQDNIAQSSENNDRVDPNTLLQYQIARMNENTARINYATLVQDSVNRLYNIEADYANFIRATIKARTLVTKEAGFIERVTEKFKNDLNKKYPLITIAQFKEERKISIEELEGKKFLF